MIDLERLAEMTVTDHASAKQAQNTALDLMRIVRVLLEKARHFQSLEQINIDAFLDAPSAVGDVLTSERAVIREMKANGLNR